MKKIKYQINKVKKNSFFQLVFVSMAGEESPPSECKECHYNAKCIQRECVCKAGYTGDGFDCRRKYLHATVDY